MDKSKKKTDEVAETPKPVEQSKEKLRPILDVHGSPVRDANGNELFERRNRADDL